MVDFTLEIVACFDEAIHELQKEMLLVRTQKSNFSDALVRKQSLLELRATIWRVRELVTELKENEFLCFTPRAIEYVYRQPALPWEEALARFLMFGFLVFIL